MDLVLYATIVVLFATWGTVHLVLCIELAKKDWRRAMGGFVVFPLAPYFGYDLQIRKWPVVWVASAVLYGFALVAGAL